MTIYLQPGANGDFNKPKKIRIVTVNSFPSFHGEFGYGQNNPYHTGQWNRGMMRQDLIFPQDNTQTISGSSSNRAKFDYDYYKRK